MKAVLFGMVCILGMGLEKSSAGPAFLLTIDVSNPSAVTITATGANSAVDDSGRFANDGIDLLGFFSQPVALDTSVPASTLQGGGLTLSYNVAGGDIYSSDDVVDLNLYYAGPSGNSTPEIFSTDQPAFTGSMTVDFSSLDDLSALPTVGSQGQILSGYSANPGAVIGSWQVVAPVPEPGTGSLLILGSAAGFIFWRRRARENAVVLP